MPHQTQTYHIPVTSPAAKSYAKFLRDMRARYPNLINLEHEFEHPKYNRDCRVCMIVVPSEDPGHEFNTPQQLHDHLGKPEPVPSKPLCRVYVVENLTLEYIAVFGHQFNVDPTVFASQIRTANWEGELEGNNTPKLLLCREPNCLFTLRYGEVRLFNEPIAGLRLTDNKAGRVITVTTTHIEMKNFHHVGVVRRCISFWCKKNSNIGCWDVLILVDPQVKECLQETRRVVNLKEFNNVPYQSGYADFTPWSEALKAVTVQEPGPSRTCAYDDILYYLRSKWVANHQEPTPYVPAMIVKNLFLSHTIALIEYLKALISTLEDRIRRSRGGIENYAWLQETLTELFGWNRRLSEYCEHTEAALDGLHILHNSEVDTTAEDDRWRSGDEDFRYVHRRMLNLKRRIYELITFANGLIGLVEAQRSLDTTKASLDAVRASSRAAKASVFEAKAVRNLTIIGILFIPLGVTSGLFSMGQNYGPGQSQFWVYWVIAIPLVCVAFIGLYLAHGFSDFKEENES